MTDYLSPGVYIQELEGPPAIVGVSTSIAGVVGLAERGPFNVPILCSGPGDYTRWFGGLLDRVAFQDPTDPDRAHCWLPYAVAGFFNNQGQLLYVTRVLPPGATYAGEWLYDRTGLASAPGPTTLVRAAAPGDGFAPGNPLITLFPAPPPSTAAQPSWMRIGDDSSAEYGQVESVTTASDACVLDFPLQNYHAAGASFAVYTGVAASPNTYMLAADAPAGSIMILAQAIGGATLATPEITTLTATNTVIQFATADFAVVVAPASVVQTGASTFTITLASPLTVGLTSLVSPPLLTNLIATLITPLAAATPTGDTLEIPAVGGDALVFTSAPYTVGQLIDIDPANPAIREIRTIASEDTLTSLSFEQPNTLDWPAGTVVAPVAVASNAIAAISGAIVTLDNCVGVLPGSVLRLNDANFATVTLVNSTNNQVTLASPPPATVAVNDSVELVSTSTLAAPVVAGGQQITVTGRAGINAGTILMIGSGSTQEYAVVLSATGIRALGLDPGILVLEAPLAHGYLSAPVAVVNLAPLPQTALGPFPVAANTYSTVSGNTIQLASLFGIIPGSVLELSGGAKFTVGSVSAATSQVTLTAPPGPASNQTAVLFSTTTLSAAANGLPAPPPPRPQQILVNNRAGINAGAVLEIDAEYAIVLSVPGTRVPNNDPGLIVLAAPLMQNHGSGDPVILVGNKAASAVSSGPANNAPRATPLVLDMPAGSSGGYVAWSSGWSLGQLTQITLADGTVCYNTLSAAAVAKSLDKVMLATALQGAHPAGSTIVSRDKLIQVQALDAGSWGNRVIVSVQDESPGLVVNAPVKASLGGGTQLTLANLTGVQPGSYLEMLFTGSGALVDPTTPLKVASVNYATLTITLDASISPIQASAVGNLNNVPIYLRSREFRLTVYLQQQPSAAVPARNIQIIQTETYRNLAMDPRHSQYFQTIIGAINGPKRLSDNRPQGSSWLIRTQDVLSGTAAQIPRLGPEALVDVLSTGQQRPSQFLLENGDDGVTSLTSTSIADQLYIGADSDDPTGRSGLYSLLNVPDISIVAIPGQGTPAVQQAIVTQCETSLYRFGILDAQYPDSAIADVQSQRQQFDTKFAALYYPWLTIPEPNPVNLNNILDFPLPPSGHIAGIYAQVDDSRGVFKAPANVVVQGITGLTATLAQGDQDVLNPSPTNVNVIRDFRQSGRGIRVWGARIITSDANYTYVPVKRLMMFIEQSLDVGLQDIVFEPNAPPLWASVERLIGNFLTTVWNAGGLQGDTAADAFFVRCDLTTMTQTDIDAGRLIAQVGVAPVYPAEFVIIQISLTIPATSN